MSIRNEGEKSPFVQVGRGTFALKRTKPASAEDQDEAGSINAFGMYWRRAGINWTTAPKLLGQQQPGSEPVDFCQQKGVYLLHDGSKVVYVGRTTDQPLGLRLKQHTSDRLNGRWDRFSWFGVFAVTEDGRLSQSPPDKFNLENLIATMEALLIEGLEPPQNRKRGDDFIAVEFLQIEDPQIKKNQMYEMIESLKNKL